MGQLVKNCVYIFLKFRVIVFMYGFYIKLTPRTLKHRLCAAALKRKAHHVQDCTNASPYASSCHAAEHQHRNAHHAQHSSKPARCNIQLRQQPQFVIPHNKEINQVRVTRASDSTVKLAEDPNRLPVMSNNDAVSSKPAALQYRGSSGNALQHKRSKG